MSGLELMGEVPFHDVIIHSTIQAPDGRRMSKSLGTGIDPLEVIGSHGADATRYGLLKMSSTQDVRFNVGMIDEGRKLANKLWNVSRLILANAGDSKPDVRPASVEERWILARLDAARGHIERELEAFDFAGTGEHALPHHVRRLLRLVRGSDQAAALRRRRGRARNRACGARAAAQAPPPRDAARDRGDLVEPARPRVQADRRRVAGRRPALRRRRRRARARAGRGRDLPPEPGAGRPRPAKSAASSRPSSGPGA